MKSYQFTLTDKYVSSWGFIEAVRELLQNAYDYGDYDVSFDSNSITIMNSNDKIPIKTLLMGYGTKANDKNSVGGFGEGFVLALLVLIRDGFSVSIENADEIWEPYFNDSDEFDERLFYIDVSEGDSSNKDLSITISGFSPEQLNSIKDEFLGLQGDYAFFDTVYGQILIDDNQKGKMYVEGLPITTDRDFNYGFNFKSEYVILDRDRKDINHKELRKLTSLALVSMLDTDFDFIDDVVDNGKNDAYALNHGEIDLPDPFIRDYAEHLKERYEVKDNSVVVNKTDEKVIQELEEMGEDVVKVDRKIFADIINEVDDYSRDKYEEASSTVNSRSKVDDAWSYYRCSSYHDFREWLNNYKDQLSAQAIEDFEEILACNEPYLFELIRDDVINGEK